MRPPPPGLLPPGAEGKLDNPPVYSPEEEGMCIGLPLRMEEGTSILHDILPPGGGGLKRGRPAPLFQLEADGDGENDTAALFGAE